MLAPNADERRTMLHAIGPRRIHATAMLIAFVAMSLAMAIPTGDIVLGMLVAAALVVVGVRIGGAESLDGVFVWLVLPHKAMMALVRGEDDASARTASADRRADHSAHIAAVLAGGDVGVLLGTGDAGPAAFRQHRIGKARAEDGAIGWWIDVPDGVGEMQLRANASPATPISLHVAFADMWIAGAGPAPGLLVHRMSLPAGPVWIQVSVTDAEIVASGILPVLELWIEPLQAAPSGAMVA